MQTIKLVILIALFVFAFLSVKSEQDKLVQYADPLNDVSVAQTDSCVNDSVRYTLKK